MLPNQELCPFLILDLDQRQAKSQLAFLWWSPIQPCARFWFSAFDRTDISQRQ